MRVDWFSPLLPAETDIANYTSRVLPELSQRADVTLWTDAENVDPSVTKIARVRMYRGAPESYSAHTVRIFHLGNDRRFHESIFRLCSAVPGIVVLHELDLSEMMEMIGRRDRTFRKAWRELAREPDWSRRLPLKNATGVFVHTRAAAEHLRELVDCPVSFHPLPYPAGEWTHRERSPGTPMRLVVFGYLGANRQLDVILRAMGTFSRRDELRLDIYGPVHNAKAIARLRSRLKLDDRVAFHGAVSEAQLDEALQHADLALNLRNPTRGEGSGSQLRIWDHALPSVVTRTGAYAAFPQDAVAHVDVGNEIAGLHQHFARMLDAPGEFRQLGERGRAELLRNHSPASYVEALLALAAETRRQQ